VTLRARFATTVALVAAIAAAVAAGLSYQSIRVRLDRAVTESVVAGATRQADRLIRGPARRPDRDPRDVGRDLPGANPGFRPGRFEPPGSDRVPAPPGSSEELLIVQWVDTSGKVVASFNQVELPRDGQELNLVKKPKPAASSTLTMTRARVRTVTIGDNRYRMATVGVPGIGGVQAARNIDENSQVLNDLIQHLALLVLGTVLAAAFAGWMLARSATRRLQSLTATATTIAQTGTLSQSVSGVGKGRDETTQLANAFDKMISALATSRDQQQRLVEDASHELRTPLTSLRTNLAVLPKMDRLPQDDRDRLVSDVRSEVEELVILVEELVQHATEARGDDRPEQVSISETARLVIDRVQRRTGRTISLHADDSEVWVPPASLERALLNLINNATKFSPAGASIVVDIAAGSTTVTDHGTGISLADLPHIFDRFYRATDKRDLPGSGLGLAIVSEVATRWGGSVSARNVAPHGAAVTITLPSFSDRLSSPTS
jgi:two-component system, OmpR family, sensor histidine kinase MprB